MALSFFFGFVGMEKGERQLAKFHISEGMGNTKSDWKDWLLEFQLDQ